MMEGLRRIGMYGEDEGGILRFLESSGGKKDVFRFLANIEKVVRHKRQ